MSYTFFSNSNYMALSLRVVTSKMRTIIALMLCVGLVAIAHEVNAESNAFKKPNYLLAQSGPRSNENEIALNFVRATGLNRNFRNLVTRTVIRTQSFKITADGLGKMNTINALNEAMKAAVVVYGEKWDRNLASTYLEYFDAHELISLQYDRNSSPYLSKLKANEKRVAESMRKKSLDILKTASTQVLKHVFKTYTESQK